GYADFAFGRQRAWLQRIAVDELTAQRDRLRTYMVQARFSLAALYDRAAAVVPAPAPDSQAAAGESE
ncbi:MAG: hypothetical protein PVG24_02640, partial [Gammaproteobacteria bacterium]